MDKRTILTALLVLCMALLVACAPPGAVRETNDSGEEPQETEEPEDEEPVVEEPEDVDVGLQAEISVDEIDTERRSYGSRLNYVVVTVNNTGSEAFRPRIVTYAWDPNAPELENFPLSEDYTEIAAGTSRSIAHLRSVQFQDATSTKNLKVEVYGRVRQQGEYKQQLLDTITTTFTIQ